MQKSVITVILLCIVSAAVEASGWTGTWGCSIYSDSQLDANIGNATLRQVVRVSIPGNQLRLKFSNLYGTSLLVMQKVHLAQSTGGHSINTSTDIAVTFSGSESVTIPAGGAVTSDALIYNLPALTNVAITIYFGSVPSTKSGHVGSRTTSYYQSGDAVTASSLTSPVSSERWYVIAGIDVYREDDARAVVAFGDSITDGYGTTTNAQNRWTDTLATRLQGETQTSDVGMLNQGIGGTLVAGSGLSRLNRDVLQQTDVRYLIVLYGVNDILFADSSSSTIISAYQTILTNAHNNDILVYGGTITPFGGYSSYTPARETVRQQVNTWIRNTSPTAGGFDAVIDFDVALRDPSDHTRLLSSYSNDWLHPSIAGYQAMAEAINLGLFSLDETPPAVPTGLTATAQSYKKIDLNWNDNGESDLSHYNVWRSTTAGGPYSQIATNVTASFYSDTALSASTPYYYVVTAVDISSNESANSAEAMDTTHVLPDDTEPPTPNPAIWASVPSAVSGSVINMTAATGSDAYGPVQYSFEEISGNPGATSSGWQAGSSYADTGLSPGTHYTYRVRMRDDLGNIGNYSSSRSAVTLGTYKESGGVLSMEAENGTVGSRWLIGADAGASNDAYIEINSAYNNITYAPECITAECIAAYDFNISTPGNYRFWFRIYSGNADDDSFFWRIDSGSWIFENNRFGIGSWFSTDNTQVDTLGTGDHVLQIGYRENGTRLDKFVVGLDSLTAPSGDGPAQSSQNYAPVFTSNPINNLGAVELEIYVSQSLATYANDVDGMNTVTFSKVSGPDWLAVASDGTLSGFPVNSDVGANVFAVRVTDTGGLYDTAQMNITVANIYSGVAGLDDLIGFASQWQMSGCTDIPACNGADLDGDQDVDLEDFSELAFNWLVSEDLQLYLKLDETSGTTAADDSLHSHSGVLTNGPTWSTEGKSGGTLSFDGTDDYVEISGYKGVTGTASRTCCAWIKTTAVGQGNILSWGAEVTGQKWTFRTESNGVLGVGVWGGYISTTAAINNGQWHHVAAVLNDDGSPSVNEILLYIDGILQSTSASNSQSITTIASQDVILGAYKNAGVATGYYNGLLDEVRIYNRALTASEIAALTW